MQDPARRLDVFLGARVRVTANFTLAEATVFGNRRLHRNPAETLPISRAQLKDFGHTREKSRQFQALPMARVVLRRHVWLAM
jgi:hypothetical protein